MSDGIISTALGKAAGSNGTLDDRNEAIAFVNALKGKDAKVTVGNRAGYGLSFEDIDALVASGKLSKEEGAALKALDNGKEANLKGYVSAMEILGALKGKKAEEINALLNKPAEAFKPSAEAEALIKCLDAEKDKALIADLRAGKQISAADADKILKAKGLQRKDAKVALAAGDLKDINALATASKDAAKIVAIPAEVKPLELSDASKANVEKLKTVKTTLGARVYSDELIAKMTASGYRFKKGDKESEAVVKELGGDPSKLEFGEGIDFNKMSELVAAQVAKNNEFKAKDESVTKHLDALKAKAEAEGMGGNAGQLYQRIIKNEKKELTGGDLALIRSALKLDGNKRYDELFKADKKYADFNALSAAISEIAKKEAAEAEVKPVRMYSEEGVKKILKAYNLDQGRHGFLWLKGSEDLWETLIDKKGNGANSIFKDGKVSEAALIAAINNYLVKGDGTLRDNKDALSLFSLSQNASTKRTLDAEDLEVAARNIAQREHAEASRKTARIPGVRVLTEQQIIDAMYTDVKPVDAEGAQTGRTERPNGSRFQKKPNA